MPVCARVSEIRARFGFGPSSGCPGFPQEDLSDEELRLILAYLNHMADRKSRATEGGSSKR